MRYVLEIAYDGSDFSGWQIQKNAPTVQEEVQKALLSVTGVNCAVTASGRTDAGVHAARQVCHFDCETTVPAAKFRDALNAALPAGVRVLRSAEAPAGFDANRSAKRKTYAYRTYFSPTQNPLKDRYAVWIKGSPDFEKLQYICRLFEGEHDFKAFCASGSSVKTTVRTIYLARVEKSEGDGYTDVIFTFTGNGFLYNMVRTLVGTALAYSSGAIGEERVLRALGGDRSAVGKTMPPQGLTLESVDYGVKLFG